MKEITKPIGLTRACSAIEYVCQDVMLYVRCGMKPPHFMLPMDPGSGRSTLISYMIDMYKAHGILDFSSGLDDCIEVTFDGSLPQIRKVVMDIQSAAVYSNAYSGIVSMDITNIALHLNETQCTEFINCCKKVCKDACVVFFLSAHPSRNEEKLAEKIRNCIAEVQYIENEPYTSEELCLLAEKHLDDMGIEIHDPAGFHAALLNCIPSLSCSTVSDALHVGDMLAHFTDFSAFTPSIDKKGVASLAAQITLLKKGDTV